MATSINKKTFPELQKESIANKKLKGFNTTDVNYEFLLLYGEVGEAWEAWRRKKGDVGSELADVAIFLLGIAEILNIDLETEIHRKMEINRNRVYELVNGVYVKKEANTETKAEVKAEPVKQKVQTTEKPCLSTLLAEFDGQLQKVKTDRA